MVAPCNRNIQLSTKPAFFLMGTSQHPKVGELYLWSMLHQMKLCRPSLFEKTPQLEQFYGRLEKDPKVQKVARCDGHVDGGVGDG